MSEHGQQNIKLPGISNFGADNNSLLRNLYRISFGIHHYRTNYMIGKYIMLALCLAATTIWAETKETEIWDFENPAENFVPHLTIGASWQYVPDGFESDRTLEFTVPSVVNTGQAAVSRCLELPKNLATRHFRITWWMKIKKLAGPGGAGVVLRFLNANHDLLGIGGMDKLYTRQRKSMNKWEKIDYMKDRCWQCYALEFDVPYQCRYMDIAVGIFNATGNIKVDRLIVTNRPSVPELLQINDPVCLKIEPKIEKVKLSPLLFTANADYMHDGLYYGTLPESNPLNKRKQFAEALKTAGIRVIRFPGGMPCHRYLIEGQKYQNKKACYPLINNVLEFCREYGIELLFQTNDLRFVNKDGKLERIFKKAKASNGTNKVAEATKALSRFINSIPAGCKIKYWEIGNEDFSLMSVEHYVLLVNSFVKVIKVKFPDAIITVTGNVWTTRLCELMKQSGIDKDITYLAVHYPWGSHWRPVDNSPIGNADLDRFVMSELRWDLNMKAHKQMMVKAGVTHIKPAATETNVYKFHVWNTGLVIYTPAQALTLAHNWIEAMKLPDMDIMAYHDLDSTYFGLMPYDTWFDPKKRVFHQIPKDMKSCPPGADKRYFAQNRYTLYSSAYAMGVLSRHIGESILKTTITAPKEPTSVINADQLVTRGKHCLRITLVNRAKVPRSFTLNCRAFKTGNNAEIFSTSWATLDAMPDTKQSEKQSIELANGKIKLESCPFSITQVVIPLISDQHK